MSFATCMRADFTINRTSNDVQFQFHSSQQTEDTPTILHRNAFHGRSSDDVRSTNAVHSLHRNALTFFFFFVSAARRLRPATVKFATRKETKDKGTSREAASRAWRRPTVQRSYVSPISPVSHAKIIST